MRLLIVDDSLEERELLQVLLQKAGYSDLYFCTSSEELFDYLGVDFPEQDPGNAGLILLDVMMPGIDGIEACRRIKSDQRYAEIPILMVTGNSSRDILEAAFAAGATDYIVKPYKKFELLARIRSAVRLSTAVMSLRKSEKRLRDITSHIGEGILVINPSGKIAFANPEAERLLGIPSDKIRNAYPDDIFSCESGPGISDILSEGKPATTENLKFANHFQRLCPASLIATPITEDGRYRGMVLAFRDISERKQMEEHLRLAARLIEHSPNGLLVTNKDGNIIQVNPAFESITGYNDEEVLGKNPSLLQSGYHDQEFYRTMWKRLIENRYWEGEIYNRRKNGEIYPQWLQISAINDESDQIEKYMAIFSDITERKKTEMELEFMANHDVLTGLPNRYLLSDRLKHNMAHARRLHNRLAILFLDLDNFKPINDELGHARGDNVLREVADRLKRCVRETDTVARIGGDEFIILITGLTTHHDAEAVSSKVIESLMNPIKVDGHLCSVGASIGISVYPDHGEDIDALITAADKAMYVSKNNGRNQYTIALPVS